MLTRTTRIFSLLWLCVGLGLSGYYGLQWYQLPSWSPVEIDESVELNLAMDLQRMGTLLRPTGEKLDRMRALVRSEVVGQIQMDEKNARRGTLAGVIMLMLGLAPLLYERSRARIAPVQRP